MPAYRLPDAYAPQTGDAFGLADFIAIITKRKALILQVTAALMIAAVLFAFSLPTIWTSSAVVMLEPRRAAPNDAPAPTAQIDAATLQNQIQILQSRELAARVIADLELQNDPEFNGTLSAPGLMGVLDPRNWGGGAPVASGETRDQIIANFLSNVSAEPNGQSTSITVTARARNAEKAARIANAMVNAYVQDQMAGRQASTSQTTQWLEERANNLAREVQLQNEDIQRFRARNGLADTGPGTSLNDQQMLAINTQIVQARSDLDQKLAIQRSMAGSDPANSAQAVASPLIQQLRSQAALVTREEADLNTRYGPMHPKLVQLQAQRRDIDQRIAQEATRISGVINSDVDTARNHLGSLQASLARTQGTSVNQNMARGELSSMEANAASTRTAYEAFITRLRNAQDQDSALTAESRVLSPAAIPQSPASPKRKLIVGASLPLGLMLGTLLALLLEKFGYLLRPKARRRNGAGQGRTARRLPVTDWDGPPILGEISNTGTLKAADYVVDWPSSRFAHATVALVRQLESRGHEGAVVALTAPEPGDAKSVVAISLARAAAKLGKKTIIIDCDPSHRTASALQANGGRAGLYEVLTGAVPLNDALAKDPRGTAFVLTLKQRPAQASAMFASPQMARLLDILRDACDFVILDCGPVLNSPDAALIARHADATLLVSRRDRLQARSVANATQVLQNGQAAPVGLVLAS